MARIVILGAGVMGSAMAVPAAANGHQVSLVGTYLDSEIITSVKSTGRHPRLNITLPDSVTPHAIEDWVDVIAAPMDLLILGVSSAGIDWAIDRMCADLDRMPPILIITKGLRDDGADIEVLPRLIKRSIEQRTGIKVGVMAVAGPCIAGELAMQRDTSVIFTGEDDALVSRAIEMLSAPFYHVRSSADLMGVEYCAAFKNFYSLAVGWVQGHLEVMESCEDAPRMHNLASGIFTQSIHELRILVENSGGDTASVIGLPGVGDLFVTCLAGRNSRMGRLLGLGYLYSHAKNSFMAEDTVEGAELALALGPALRRLWSENRLPMSQMPLTRSIVEAICDDKPLVMMWEEFAR